MIFIDFIWTCNIHGKTIKICWCKFSVLIPRNSGPRFQTPAFPKIMICSLMEYRVITSANMKNELRWWACLAGGKYSKSDSFEVSSCWWFIQISSKKLNESRWQKITQILYLKHLETTDHGSVLFLETLTSSPRLFSNERYETALRFE